MLHLLITKEDRGVFNATLTRRISKLDEYLMLALLIVCAPNRRVRIMYSPVRSLIFHIFASSRSSVGYLLTELSSPGEGEEDIKMRVKRWLEVLL